MGRWRIAVNAARLAAVFRADSSYDLYRPGVVSRREGLAGPVADTIPPFVIESGAWGLRSLDDGTAVLCVRPDVASELGFGGERCGSYAYTGGATPTLTWKATPRGASFAAYGAERPSEVHVGLVSPTPEDFSGRAKGAVGGTASVSTDQPYFEFQVEKQVQTASGSPAPRYPDMLRSANIEGEVLAQFVVDTTGRFEPGSFKVIKSSHDLFTAAVKNALPGMRFYPAEIGGRKVKQLVQQPFTFGVAR